MEHDKAAVPDPVWGELDPFEAPLRIADGAWSFLLEPAGITAITFAGRELVAKLFFSVRDLAWATPRLRLGYRYRADGVIEFSGIADDAGLAVDGSVRIGERGPVVEYTSTALRETSVARMGPAMLHEPGAFWPGFRCDQSSPDAFVPTPQHVRIARVASGFTRLEFSTQGIIAAIRFDGARFEMEDQRNWGDSTFKSYCPPLGGPRIELEAGSAMSYRVSIEADTTDVEARVEPEAPGLESAPQHGMLPSLGLAHSGGPLVAAAAAALRELGLGYLHLLVELADVRWRERLAADLEAAAQLGVDAVLSIDVPGDSFPALAEVGALCAGRASTAFVFDAGESTTSEELARSASAAFTGAGMVAGGGSRSHFASIASAGGVPDALASVAIPLAVAAHDNDRRTLAEAPDSFAAIIREARTLAGDRDILVGPVGFRPTFDPWLPPGTPRDLRSDWLAAHPRDGSVFAAAWMIAALGALAETRVRRVTIAATVGPRGVLGVDGASLTRRPTFDALSRTRQFDGTEVHRLTPQARIGGFGTTDRSLLGDLRDEGPGVIFDNLQGGGGHT